MTTKKKLRSTEWFGREDRDAITHRSWMKNQGIPHDQFDGRPVIGICNTWSQATPCNAHFRELAQHVRDGVQWPLHHSPGTEGQAVAYGVRPGDLSLTKADAPGSVTGEIVVVEPTGAETELLIQAGQAQLILVTHGRPSVNPGDRVGLAVAPGKVHVFDQGSGQRIAA